MSFEEEMEELESAEDFCNIFSWTMSKRGPCQSPAYFAAFS